MTENAEHVQGTQNTNEISIIRNNDQSIDVRLILNNKNSTMAEEFINIICEYNTYEDSPINEVGAYIINRVGSRYTQAMRVVQRCRRWVKV